MYILGHTMLTVAAARAVDRKIDLRLPILLSLLPDLLDKPTAVLLPALVNGNTRNFGHTVLGASVVLAVLLDRMWLGNDLTILCWPFMGVFPPWSPDGPATPYLMPYNIAGEALGLGLMLFLARSRRPAPIGDARPALD